MNCFDLPRVPEPEVMDDSSEVQAYSSAAADAFLSHIDDTFAEHALRLIGPVPGCALDIGCGPGQILMKLSARLPEWNFLGVDRSLTMIHRAREMPDSRERSGVSHIAPSGAGNVYFLAGDAGSLPFRDSSFDFVLCNSVLHHIVNPSRLFAEIRRVAKPGAAILLRDLRRPSRIHFPFHVRWYGRHYGGLMYKLYCDSVRAAYTSEELSAMLRASGISGARVFTRGSTHLGIERHAHAVTHVVTQEVK
jgi:ubiquinone/menaquinone biosynthesis C-methylase UbiE